MFEITELSADDRRCKLKLKVESILENILETAGARLFNERIVISYL